MFALTFGLVSFFVISDWGKKSLTVSTIHHSENRLALMPCGRKKSCLCGQVAYAQSYLES